MFQSPLHRGLGSDMYKVTVVEITNFVSIPSSSGPGFGLLDADTEVVSSPEVSIPSSSGPGFGRHSGSTRTARAWMFQSPLHRGLGSDSVAR